MYYMVGLVGLNVVYLFPWTDAHLKFWTMHSGGANFLPENVDLDSMNLRTGSKLFSFKTKITEL